MFQINRNDGFTIVEILVTLVLLGLIASVTIPGVDAWLAARNKETIRSALVSQFALLPMEARLQSRRLQINKSSDIDVEGAQLFFIRPLVVLENGFCLGGEFELDFDSNKETYVVLPPFCQMKRKNEQV